MEGSLEAPARHPEHAVGVDRNVQLPATVRTPSSSKSQSYLRLTFYALTDTI
jgi:hypothetical protein